jgi:hypothetical protein
MVGDHYEVKVDGEWMRVPSDKINNVVAPDGGAHRAGLGNLHRTISGISA